MELGARIKHFRKKRGLTQIELAELANISRSYLADMERDRYNPSLDTLIAIAQALHIELSELVGEKEKSPAENLVGFLEMELSNEDIVKLMKFTVDGMTLSEEEALEFVEFVRVRRAMRKAAAVKGDKK